jgi:hypothetical protein
MPSTGWPFAWPWVEARTGAFNGSLVGELGFCDEDALTGCIRW